MIGGASDITTKNTSTLPLGGLWVCPSPRAAGGDDYLYIDEARGRILGFVAMAEVPIERMPMRTWYRVESETVLNTKLWNGEKWQTLPCRLEGDALYLAYNGGWYGWERVAPENVPDWLERGVALAYSQLWLNPHVRYPEDEFTAALREMSVGALRKFRVSLAGHCPQDARELGGVEGELVRRGEEVD